MKLLAGAAREIITPKIGSLLFGYNDHQVSHSVHDDLTVTAIVLESNGKKIVLLSATVCLFHTELSDKIRLLAGAGAGVPADQVLLHATHTHSGPCTDGFASWGTVDWEYCNNILIPKCVSAVKAANSAMQPAKVGITTTQSKVGINRRELHRDGTVHLGQNPWDIYDPEMTVISLAGENGKKIANIVHIGAHCTAAGISHEITRDWAGVMLDRLEEESGAISMFLNGTAGDVAPRMANGGSIGDMRHVMELGGLAGIDAVKAYKSIRTYRHELLDFIHDDFEIPFEPTIPADAVQKRLAALGDNWSWEKNSLERLAALYEKGEKYPDSLTYRQIIVKLGPLVFVPYPFEVSGEIGLRLRHYSPFAHSLVLSFTNGSNSYLPAQSQLCRGGYEVESFRWFRPVQLPDNTDTLLIEKNLQLISSVYNVND